jgi:hypothetical protein
VFGPGEYVSDPTTGITRIEDLPEPEIVRESRIYKNLACVNCGHKAYHLRTCTRVLHDLGDMISGKPRDMVVTYSQHHCPECNCYFNADMSDLALPNAHYTHRVVSMAVRLVVEDGLPYRTASWHLWRDSRTFVPWGTIQNWVEATGKKK